MGWLSFRAYNARFGSSLIWITLNSVPAFHNVNDVIELLRPMANSVDGFHLGIFIVLDTGFEFESRLKVKSFLLKSVAVMPRTELGEHIIKFQNYGR